MDHVALISNIHAWTALAVGIILAFAALGSALGWGLICSKTLEGLTRQPEMAPVLMKNTFLFGGLMEAFPMIALGLSMWFALANPFQAGIPGI
jgi:F-type H+-transporting ATPase subunit c